MTDNTELQRLIRLSRLGRQIAARLPADLDHELHGYLRELPARAPSKPTSSKAVLSFAARLLILCRAEVPIQWRCRAAACLGGGGGELPRTGYTLPTGTARR